MMPERSVSVDLLITGPVWRPQLYRSQSCDLSLQLSHLPSLVNHCIATIILPRKMGSNNSKETFLFTTTCVIICIVKNVCRYTPDELPMPMIYFMSAGTRLSKYQLVKLLEYYIDFRNFLTYEALCICKSKVITPPLAMVSIAQSMLMCNSKT